MNEEVRETKGPAVRARQSSPASPKRAAWVKRQNRKLGLIRGAILLFGSTVLLLGLLLLILPTLKVKNIQVEYRSDRGITPVEEIVIASGVSEGDEILGVDLKQVMKNIHTKCPHVSVYTVSKTLNSVKIVVEPRATLYMEFGGQWFALGEDLTVLSVSSREESYGGLLRIELPQVNPFALGDRLCFTDGSIDRTYITTMLTLIEDGDLTDRVTMLDVSEKFNVSYVLDGTHRIVLGKVADLPVKLALADRILTAKEGSSACAVVDVSDLKQSTYRPMETLG